MSGTVDDLVRRALQQVIAVPVVEGDVRVVPKGAGYAYADPRLEALPPVSKLLLRMGPETVRRVQGLARELTASHRRHAVIPRAARRSALLAQADDLVLQ